MIVPDRNDGRVTSPERERRDAAWNAVACASIAHREARDALDRETETFARILAAARTYGLTLSDLCRASGLDEEYVAGFLAVAD
jgi:oligoendopeptidase F